ncbi:MAG: hypothetical protein KDC38_00660, partial [Planctomycetes bacterium]|nr:hypothetical protein [Planctomycetota bacterium]
AAVAKKKKPKGKKSTESSKPKAPVDDTIHLEETLEHATDAVRGFFTQYRVPLLVGLCAIIAIFAIVGMIERFGTSSLLSDNAALYVAFKESPNVTDEQISERVAKVVKANSGYGWMAADYAGWLLQKGEPGNRERALEVIREAKKNDADNPLVTFFASHLESAASLDADFHVPPPPVEPAPETSSTTPKVEVPPIPSPSAAGTGSDPAPTTTDTPQPTSQPATGG